ncbi:hypothetical protein MPSEU_000674400 [Mayamaea pseudoterrestris]|nr:hypothetical protein MPSEU_000674400 [Mayamaea pseudoterrestris]
MFVSLFFAIISLLFSTTMTSATKPSIKLTYFDIAGVGEQVRLAFVLSKTPFEDDRVNFSNWPALKPTTPSGKLPLMTIDGGAPRTQSMAMLRYVGATCSDTLYPREQLFDIEEALGVVNDFWTSWSPCLYMGMSPQDFGYPQDFGKTDEGKEKIKQMRTNWLETKLPEHAKHIASMIEKSGGVWMASKDQPTIADCAAFCQLNAFTRGYMDHVPADSLSKYPELTAFLERFKALPEVKEWYAAAK